MRLFVGLAALVTCLPTTAWAQRGPALVKIAPIEEREVLAGQTFVGTVTPSRKAAIGSAVDGRVIKFLVNEGDRVEANEALAELLTETIKLELKAAEAELELRDQELKELENGARPDEIEQAQAAMKAAESTASLRETIRERTVAVSQQRGAATVQQVDEATSMATTAQEAYVAARAKYNLIVEGPRPETIAQAKARRAIQAALVDKLEDQIKKHVIRARFAGYVIAEHSEVGQWVSRGDLVAEVVALDDVDIEARVVENQIPYVKIGASVRVSVPALPDRIFIGKVVSVIPSADPLSRTFPVKVRVQNEFERLPEGASPSETAARDGESLSKGQPVLKAGMLAQVWLPTGNKKTAQLVSKDAINFGGPSPTIWTVIPSAAKADEKTSLMVAPATMVPVRLGVSDGSLIEVTGDIPAGSSVAVLGNERIIPSRGPEPTMVQWVPPTQPKP